LKIFLKSELQLPCFHSQICGQIRSRPQLLNEFAPHMESQETNEAVQDRMYLSDIYPSQAALCMTHKVDI